MTDPAPRPDLPGPIEPPGRRLLRRLPAPPPRRGLARPASLRGAALLLAGSLLGGVAVYAASPHAGPPVSPPLPAVAVLPPQSLELAPAAPPAPPPGAAGAAPAVQEVAPPSTAPPVALDMPSVRTHSALVDLHLDATGTLQVPQDYKVAGWFSDGTLPGDAGAPAVILGHVDSTTGPAVFYRLASLKSGDPLVITRSDGTQLRFAVYGAADYQKDTFPTDVVYAAQPQPELRLITCSGTFDRHRKSYRSNHVVFAREVPAPGTVS